MKGIKLKFDRDGEATPVDPHEELAEKCIPGPCKYAELIDNDGAPQLFCNLAYKAVFSFLWSHGGCPDRKWDKCENERDTKL